MSDLISRQDAIRWVKIECNPYGKPTLDFESGKKVIGHLKQMPSVEAPTGLISKEDVKWQIQEWIAELNEAIDVLDSIPSAEPKTGKWIVNISDYESVCSVCGAKETDFIYGTEMWYGLGESNYCPNCGAKMRGEEE